MVTCLIEFIGQSGSQKNISGALKRIPQKDTLTGVIYTVWAGLGMVRPLG